MTEPKLLTADQLKPLIDRLRHFAEKMRSGVIQFFDCDLDYVADAIESLCSEIERLKRGEFTPEEFQGLCHTSVDDLDMDKFCDGCDEYQRKLFGTCRTDLILTRLPEPEDVSALLARLDKHVAMMAPHQKERRTGQLLLEAREMLRTLRPGKGDV